MNNTDLLVARLKRHRPELLSPAGDPESFRAAVLYGADAIYLGGTSFSMRTSPQNFGSAELAAAVKLAHGYDKRVYLTCNTLPRNEELKQMPGFLTQAAEAGVDALIISDLGVLEMAKRYAPDVEIHISTQAGVVNYASASALYAAGAKRVVLARELSLTEIAEIRANTPEGLEIEAFVHGAMCVSFSGRCLLSSYLTGRDSNRGDCAQPCRWKFALSEQQKTGAYFPIGEDGQGTYILNARDLCMIAHIPELIHAGVSSFKIEGRAKSAYYVAAITNAYRQAIDAAANDRYNQALVKRLTKEAEKVSHRDYCTGFYFGPIQHGQDYGGGYKRGWDVVAVVNETQGGLAYCRQRNPFSVGERLEALEPGTLGIPVTITGIYTPDGDCIREASHPDMQVIVKTEPEIKAGSMLRRASCTERSVSKEF